VTPALPRRLLAEFLGGALLAAVVVGSGIAAQRFSPGNVGLELFENAASTAAGLYALLLVFGPVSGAHLNPIVSLVDTILGGLSWRDLAAYVSVQVSGCCAGAVIANLMFSNAPVTLSTHHRTSGGHLLAEVVATAGLILVAFALARSGRAERTPGAVATYIGAAYFFTSSTSFANPAIAVGRMLSNTFAGIAPSSVPLFVLAELGGGLVGLVALRMLYPSFTSEAARSVTLPHDAEGTADPAIGKAR
jgi:glycerol uptake facilitator-like aquaporin